MITNLELLPVFNHLYSLKISNASQRFIYDFNLDYYYLSSVVKSGDYLVVKRSKYSDKIFLYDIKEFETVFLETVRNTPSFQGYLLSWSDIYNSDFLSFGIFLKNINKDDLKKIEIIRLFINNYRPSGLRSTFITKLGSTVYKDIDDFIKILREIFLTKDSELLFNNEDVKHLSIPQNIVKDFFELVFPDAMTTYVTEKNIAEDLHLYKIIRVIEISNVRFFLITGTTQPYGSNPSNYNCTLGRVTPEDNIYDYIDVGRYFYTNYRTHKVILGNVVFIENPPNIPSYDVITHFLSSNDEEFPILINNKDARLMVKRYEQYKARVAAEKEKEIILANKIQEKLDKLKNKEAPLIVNGITFTSDTITYEGQVLYLEREDWVYYLLRQSSFYFSLDSLNFEVIFEKFINNICADDRGKIGDISFTLSCKTTVNQKNIKQTRNYINDIRINHNEISECLERALCFQKQEDFDYFLSEVSKCSLNIHKYLQRGIKLTVQDTFNNCMISMQFPLIRINNINYLVFGKNKFQVRNTNKIIKLQNCNDLIEVITILLDKNVLTGVDYKYIKKLIEISKKEFTNAIEKSKKLLKDAEKTFKISMSDYKLDTGKIIHGYLIKGKKRTYILEADAAHPEIKNSVYSYPEGNYICIVDKSTAQVGMDKLVNRIYALHNDSLLASQIYTL